MMRFVACLLGLFAVIGCKSIERAQPEPSGFLGDYSILQKQEGDAKPELFWADPNTSWKEYDKVLLDPVTMWSGKNEKFDLATEDIQYLANNFTRMLNESLAKDYEMVDKPGPDTLRIQVAITKVTKAEVVMNVVTSTFIPTHAVGVLEAYVGIKPPFTGEAQVELRVMDAATSNVVMESVDRRIGTRHLVGSWESWKAVDDSMQFWSEQLVYVLCTQQGSEGCVAPTSR